MLASIGKLLFFLILWFVVGLYLIPVFLKRMRKLMSDETMLIVSLGLCFGMVVMAAHTGFSPAFGAFIMGSILAETIEAETIEHLVKPVKDLFGAIFFVSVGMMVDPAMITEYALPIIVITLIVILGQSFFGTLGVLLAGQPLKVAMQCGFSLTQIGEFAFYHCFVGCFPACDESLPLSHRSGRIGNHHFPYSLHDSLGWPCLRVCRQASSATLDGLHLALFVGRTIA